MFSPYYGGGFLKMAQITERFDVPVYAHTAGMNVYSGSANWGIGANINYLFSALCGAAFMQLTTVGGYLKPMDEEKTGILAILHKFGLDGESGMTLAIAGGMGPKVVGRNLEVLGEKGRMLLAGSSVYGHPDGPSGGVRALIAAYHAYKQKKITRLNDLIEYSRELGQDGLALLRALE
jgi:ribulose 1,5-bisphosphate carboxylase large subunit-like protein